MLKVVFKNVILHPGGQVHDAEEEDTWQNVVEMDWMKLEKA